MILDKYTCSERFKALRISKGISLEKIALNLHISPNTIYRWESGAIIKLTLDKWYILAKIFGMDINELNKYLNDHP